MRLEPVMDEVFVRRDVIDAARLRSLCAASNGKGAIQAVSHLGAIGVSGTLLWFTRGSWWAVPIFAVHGVLLNFLYAGQHELSHWTVFRSGWPNEWLGRLFGFVLFYPRTFDQVQHMAHHRFTQDWARDGELARDRYTLGSYLLWMSGVTYWYTRWRRILRFAFGSVTEPYLPAKRHAELIREARLHLAGYAMIVGVSLMAHSGAAVFLWLAPMLVMKWVHQLQNTMEHLGLPHEDNVLVNTRSTRTNAVMRWLGWQMQYHTAHHAFPGVPFHRLRELNAAIFTERGAQPPSMTYIGFQIAVLRAFGRGRTEAEYPDERTWIADAPHG
ncbi:MAG TPA: fatty acid desaturase [Steroidobacteraceae bacterium]|nr:fatty acid desaturase [Steroidobacteraceae bacterium]